MLTGLVAAWLFDRSTLQGLLLGAVLCSTDGAAIFALLRGSTLRRRLARTLEGESGFNDPVAVLLVLGFIDWITHPGYGLPDMVWLFVREVGIGAVVGLLVGDLAVRSFQRVRLSSTGLYPVASLATAALAFGGAGAIDGSGFLAVYLAGLRLGGADVPARRTLGAFHDGMAWVAQLALFVTLGLLVFPSQLDDVAVRGTVLAFVLVLVTRPLGTLLATVGFGFTLPERALLGWAGLRGAVPVVLATFPVIADVPGSRQTFSIVFFAVVVSTLLQGTTFESLAARLGLTTTDPALPRPLVESGTVSRLGAEVLEFPVHPSHAVVGSWVRDLGLPREAVVSVIVRGQEAIPPRGSTRVMAGDELHILMRTTDAPIVHEVIERWRVGPVGPPPRPRPLPRGAAPVLSSWRWRETDGDPSAPAVVGTQEVVQRLRVRRDRPGGLWALADGRYAVTGPVGALGGRADLAAWARRRLSAVDSDERAWLQTVIGALALDER